MNKLEAAARKSVARHLVEEIGEQGMHDLVMAAIEKAAGGDTSDETEYAERVAVAKKTIAAAKAAVKTLLT